MRKRKQTDRIVVHCSATRNKGRDVRARDIRRWHTDPKPLGNGWSAIGYHYVICRDGAIEPGRHADAVGAHVRGHNRRSIGICLVGGLDRRDRPKADYTAEQWDSLRVLVHGLQSLYGGDLEVIGHRDLYPKKACPCFDVELWAATGEVRE